MNSHSSSPLAVAAAVLAVVCSTLVAALTPRLTGGGRVAVVAALLAVALFALFAAGYLLRRSMTRGGS